MNSAGKEVQAINARGHANGWYAQQLQSRAARNGETMAEVYERESWKVIASNVPATCTAIRGGKAHYRFLDGSTFIKKQMEKS